MKKFLIILIIMFICGVLSADVCLKQMEENNVLLSLDFYEQYANADIVFENVFWNIVYERMKILGVLFILCFTPIKEKIGVLIGPIFSFIWGFYFMSCIMKLGIAGVVVGLACVLPHGILYLCGIVLMLTSEHERTYYRKKQGILHMLKYMVVVLLFITACVLESLIGTHFIPWLIRLSFI